MRFIYKCFLQTLFSHLPEGERLNYFFQRYITRSLPCSDHKFQEKFSTAKRHFEAFSRYCDTKPARAVYYEFGAGWDLIIPFAFSAMGFSRILAVDVRRLVFPKLLNDTIGKFKRLEVELAPSAVLVRDLPVITGRNFESVLKNCFHIEYKAPMDARKTDLDDESVDLVTSSNTLEHIPPEDISLILHECCRILKKGGIASFTIDYQDHWAYFDKSISVYNFLKYSPTQWKRYNPPLHFQNRLRHKDYLALINKTAFLIRENNPKYPSREDLNVLYGLGVHPDFIDNYTIEELLIKGSHLVLQK